MSPPPGSRGGGRKTLLTGWFSFEHGEVTAGDELALRRVQDLLDRTGAAYDVAWSPGFRPGGLHLEDADPAAYSYMLFVCGPLHGPQIAWLHERFADCVRIAVGTSTVDPEHPAVAGFHRVLPRDGAGAWHEAVDLAATAPGTERVPVVGVVLTHGQGEYGERRAHGTATGAMTHWLAAKNCARLELDTRLDAADWRHCATADQYLSAVERLDLVVTDRLHGLVLSLRQGVPVLAVDPVRGGAKVSAQARACRWPALVPVEQLAAPPPGAGAAAGGAVPRVRGGVRQPALEHWWDWCLGPGRELAGERSREFAALRPGPRPAATPRERHHSTR